MLLAFSALEAHINAIAEEFAIATDLTPHDLGVLKERDVKLEGGEFTLGNFKMYRLEDRITFLHRRFSGKALDTQSQWWGQYKAATNLRNKMTHPKEAHILSVEDVERAITSIINLLEHLYLAIYKKPFPASGYGLKTPLSF